MNPSGQPRFAIAAIFKNEGPYVLEWVAFHRAIGIDRFFIADNNSSDETTAILRNLAEAGIVNHIPFPTGPEPKLPPQVLAYEKILGLHGSEADWIAFLDADEFLVPAAPHRSLAEVVAALDPEPDVGAIVVNWAIYGSSGLKEGGTEPVAVRFVRRAEQGHPVNRHYKMIVRPEAYAGKVQNPHYFWLKEGFRSVHADGSAVTDVPGLPKGLSGETVWEPIRIHHYVIKSWDEFYYRKRARGRATGAKKERDEAFFRTHDRNDVLDPMPAWLLAAAEAEGGRIEQIVRERHGRSKPAARSDGEKSVTLPAPSPAAWRALDRPAPAPALKAAAKPSVPNKPSMPPEAVSLLTEALQGASCYLEYGSGGSTVLATSLRVPILIAVESDKDWLNLVRNRLAAADPDRLFLLHANIGPTKSLGYPVSSEHWDRYHTYPLMPWDLCRRRGFAPDLVLVDGRFRAACFLATILFARPGGRILFDDYAERPFYHTVARFVAPAHMIGRMAEFRVPESLDRDAAWQALLQAITDAR